VVAPDTVVAQDHHRSLGELTHLVQPGRKLVQRYVQ
jgi:hypothetical protein